MKSLLIWPLAMLVCAAQGQPSKPRARDLGIPFDGTPGAYNAITDVKGVEVGFKTLVSGSGKLVVGKGPVRTGVTAIFPRGKGSLERVFAAWFTLNGNGEMTGTTWVNESGGLGSPILITNTHSVGIVRDAVIEWYAKRMKPGNYDGDVSLPVVAETWDGFLNDINGFHVTSDGSCDIRACQRRKCGWRYRDDLPWIQGRNRNLIEKIAGQRRRLHSRRVGASELWESVVAANSRGTSW